MSFEYFSLAYFSEAVFVNGKRSTKTFHWALGTA